MQIQYFNNQLHVINDNVHIVANNDTMINSNMLDTYDADDITYHTQVIFKADMVILSAVHDDDYDITVTIPYQPTLCTLDTCILRLIKQALQDSFSK